MLNVIRMELSRMLKSRIFYIAITANAVYAGFMIYALTPSINEFYDSMTGENTLLPANMPCLNNICGSVITTASLFIAIFTACFIGDFYKNEFSKNVLGRVKHRYYFQAAKTVCVMIYAAIALVSNTAVTTGFAAVLINKFEFTYMKEFALFLLGEYGILVGIGLLSAFFTELFRSKIPAIVYSVFASTNIMASLINVINDNVSKWGFEEFAVQDYFVSMYQLDFYGDLPLENNIVIHALVLSFAAFLVYNVLGSVLITKKDV